MNNLKEEIVNRGEVKAKGLAHELKKYLDSKWFLGSTLTVGGIYGSEEIMSVLGFKYQHKDGSTIIIMDPLAYNKTLNQYPLTYAKTIIKRLKFFRGQIIHEVNTILLDEYGSLQDEVFKSKQTKYLSIDLMNLLTNMYKQGKFHIDDDNKLYYDFCTYVRSTKTIESKKDFGWLLDALTKAHYNAKFKTVPDTIKLEILVE
jgi:hypothetical protein